MMKLGALALTLLLVPALPGRTLRAAAESVSEAEEALTEAQADRQAEAQTDRQAESQAEAESAFDPTEQIEAAKAMDTTAIAESKDMTSVDEVGENEAEPVYADALQDGDYEVAIESSSSMFKIHSAVIHVKDGAMTMDMTLEGTSYLFLYPGTPEEAAQADAEDFIYFDIDEDGLYTYIGFPVEALDQGFQCAAFSKNKEKWYPRTLWLSSASLDLSAFAAAQGTAASDLALADGAYEVNVELGGAGSGTTVTSPAALTVEDGTAYLTLTFNSSNYDYIRVDGVQYDAIEGEETSVFEFPVSHFDVDFPLVADSTAIKGMQVEKDFTLCVSSEGLAEAE